MSEKKKISAVTAFILGMAGIHEMPAFLKGKRRKKYLPEDDPEQAEKIEAHNARRKKEKKS